MDFYGWKNIFWNWNSVDSDSSGRDLSDENIRIYNSVKVMIKELAKFQWCRKAHSFQTVKDINTKF